MDTKNFGDMDMSEEIMRSVGELGYDEATSIQSQTIPLILSGRDVIGLSSTGSGKTAAFGLPAIDMLDADGDPCITEVLVILPTRELALQACGELKKYAKYKKNIDIVPLFGGDPFDRQIIRMKKGCRVVVGTPGRLLDHIHRRTLKLDRVKLVVLDEADEMLDMGFIDDIRTILATTNANRQTVLFSATMPQEIMDITQQFLRDPATVRIEGKQLTVDTVAQYYVNTPRGRKNDVIYCLLEYYKPKSAMVFCNTKKMVDMLVAELTGRGIKAAAIHGDMRQSARTFVMDGFRGADFPILVATDVAARGIDVNDVEIVINYDLPPEDEYYIHRVGRTGRAGKSGVAISLVCGYNQFADLNRITSMARSHADEMQIPTVAMIREKNISLLCSCILDSVNDGISDKFTQACKSGIFGAKTEKELACAMFDRLLGEFSSYEKVCNDMPPMKPSDISSYSGSDVKPIRRRTAPSDRERTVFDKTKYNDSDMVTIKLTIGKRDKVSVNHILGAVAGETGLAGKLFGTIKLDDSFSTIDVPKQYKQSVLKAMNGSRIKGREIKAYVL